MKSVPVCADGVGIVVELFDFVVVLVVLLVDVASRSVVVC